MAGLSILLHKLNRAGSMYRRIVQVLAGTIERQSRALRYVDSTSDVRVNLRIERTVRNCDRGKKRLPRRERKRPFAVFRDAANIGVGERGGECDVLAVRINGDGGEGVLDEGGVVGHDLDWRLTCRAVIRPLVDSVLEDATGSAGAVAESDVAVCVEVERLVARNENGTVVDLRAVAVTGIPQFKRTRANLADLQVARG